VLQSSIRSSTLCGHWSTPFKANQIEDEKFIQPVFAVSTSKDKHLVVDDARSVELAHRCLSPDDVGDVEAEFVHTLLEVDEDNV